MCGIVGFTGAINAKKLDGMLSSVSHRGPDGEGKLKKPNFSFGMRRLAIIDPNGGWQPIWNEDKTVAVVLNGEIYNYENLWQELVALGHQFRTDHSDTETIVHAYEQWGVDCLQRLRGMFAFMLWDSRKNKLFIARDRLGIKPLYYTIHNQRAIFSSEIKSITENWGIDRSPDPAAIYKFLMYRLHDNDESTFFANIKRLLPAHYIEIDLDNPLQISPKRYWEPEINTDFASTKSDQEYAHEFHHEFMETMKLHLISDVPLGVALSGGLDSSGITSAAASLRAQGSETHTDGLLSFSTVYPGKSIDETSYIKLVSEFTGAQMNTVAPKPNDFWDEIDQWIYFQEEPTISSAPYAYYCMYRLASKQVKVTLSGNGGDELLAGYIPYFQSYISSAIDQGHKLSVIREGLMGIDIYWKYVVQKLRARLTRNPLTPRELLAPSFYETYNQSSTLNFSNHRNLNERLWIDVSRASIPNLTRYDDKNSMAFSIESRPPFLDHKLVEYIFSLPIDQKIKFGWNRYVYRNAMKQVLPKQIRKRRSKIGFTNPELEWFRAYADRYREVFASESFRGRKFWDAEKVSAAFEQVLDGRDGDILLFWRILNTELWMRVYCD